MWMPASRAKPVPACSARSRIAVSSDSEGSSSGKEIVVIQAAPSGPHPMTTRGMRSSPSSSASKGNAPIPIAPVPGSSTESLTSIVASAALTDAPEVRWLPRGTGIRAVTPIPTRPIPLLAKSASASSHRDTKSGAVASGRVRAKSPAVRFTSCRYAELR